MSIGIGLIITITIVFASVANYKKWEGVAVAAVLIGLVANFVL